MINRRGSGSLQLLLEELHFLAGKGAQEGLQHDHGFPQAGVQVIVQDVQRLPARARLGRGAVSDFFGRLAEFSLEILDGIRQGAQFMEEAGTGGKQQLGDNGILPGAALRGLPPKEIRIEGSDVGQRPEVPAVLFHRPQGREEAHGEKVEQVSTDAGLLARMNQPAVVAQCEGFVQRDAQHRVAALELCDCGAEDVILPRRVPGSPALAYRARALSPFLCWSGSQVSSVWAPYPT